MAHFETPAAEQEFRRLNPEPLLENRTREQVDDDLLEIKCDRVPDAGTQWRDIHVVPTGPDSFDIVPRVQGGIREHPPRPNNLPAILSTKGRLRKQLSPHAQLYSWLRTNNWDLRRTRVGISNVLAWMRPEGELQLGLLAAGNPLTPAQRNVLAASLKRFRTSFAKSVGRQKAFELFTGQLENEFKLGGVASLLPNPSKKAFASHLCEFAQIIKITKSLYVQVLVMKAKLKEIASLVECNKAGVVGSRDFLKRLRGIWGLFHRTCMPAIIYIRAWLEYMGLRMHGTPTGPLFMFNLWAYYVRNALYDVSEKRRIMAERDARSYIQETTVTDFRLILDPDRLHKLIDDTLKGAMPARRKNLAKDVWDPKRERPIMPGPPPEFTREMALENGWDAYLESLPKNWQQWLGTDPARGTGKKHRYRQYELNEETGRLEVSKGDDVEKSVMFRFGGQCLVDKPRGARRRHQGPPPQKSIPLYFFKESDNIGAAQIVQQIAMGGQQRAVIKNLALAAETRGGMAGLCSKLQREK